MIILDSTTFFEKENIISTYLSRKILLLWYLLFSTEITITLFYIYSIILLHFKNLTA